MAPDAETLLSALDGMKGSAILRKDGSLVASKLPGSIDVKELSKRALGLADSSRQYSEKTGSSRPPYVFAIGSEGFVAVAQSGDYILVCIIGPESDADSVESKVRKAADKLRELA